MDNNSDNRKFRYKLKKAFSSLEYALLIAILVAALTSMAFYFKRATSGLWRRTIDSEIGHGRQYDPYISTESYVPSEGGGEVPPDVPPDDWAPEEPLPYGGYP